jgi:serine/threonine-protein kinase RsbW
VFRGALLGNLYRMRPTGAKRADGITRRKRSRRSLELRLQARPEAVPVLRARLRQWLEKVGAEKGEVFEVLLATTEVFTNAVRHPHEPSSHLVDVNGSLIDGSVTIAIHDYGTWQSDETREEGGLGFLIIHAVMDNCHVEADVDGTTVTMRRRLRTD